MYEQQQQQQNWIAEIINDIHKDNRKLFVSSLLLAAMHVVFHAVSKKKKIIIIVLWHNNECEQCTGTASLFYCDEWTRESWIARINLSGGVSHRIAHALRSTHHRLHTHTHIGSYTAVRFQWKFAFFTSQQTRGKSFVVLFQSEAVQSMYSWWNCEFSSKKTLF